MTLEVEFDKQMCILCGDGPCRVRHALERRDDSKRVCGCYYYYKEDEKCLRLKR